MKFLLDVCVSSRSLTDSLAAQEHDVASVIAIDACASDDYVLGMAHREDRVLITEDKDFGELIFARGLPHGPIVRLVELSVDEQVSAIDELLRLYSHELTGATIVTLSRSRIRVRRSDG